MPFMVTGVRARFMDASGVPLSGGKVYAYAAGTNTPADTFNSRSAVVPNPWPITLDASGSADIYLNQSIKLRVTTAAGVLVEETDDIYPADTALALSCKAPYAGAIQRTQQDKNSERISIKDFGAIGDGKLYPVSDWCTVGSARYRGYVNLAAIQVDFPHVTSAGDSLDWTAIVAAQNAAASIGAKLTMPKGTYMLGSNELVFNKAGLSVECDINCELQGTGGASGYVVTFAKQGGTSQITGSHPTSIRVKGLRVRFLAGSAVVGRAAMRVCTSYCTFEDLSVTTSADAGCNGLLLESDNSGSGPYYNTFTKVSIQGSIAGATGTGLLFTQKSGTAIVTRLPNANSFFGGRVSGFAINYSIAGNGNKFFGPTSENIALTGVAFKWASIAANCCVTNTVHSPYIENAATAFFVDTLVADAAVTHPYVTGAASYLNDAGNRLTIFGGDGIRGTRLAAAPSSAAARSGIFVGNAANADTKTLDWYEEGSWTPTLEGVTTAGTYSLTVSNASFTRVGNMVMAQATVVVSITAAGTGSLKFGGLPFPKGNSRIIGGSANCTNVTLPAGGVGLVPLKATSGQDSYFLIGMTRTATTAYQLQCSDLAAGASFELTLVYATN